MAYKAGTAALLTLAVMVLAASPVRADDNGGNVIKIGVLSDMSGPYAADDGEGDVVGAKLAVEDMGGEVIGKPIQVISADTLNKPDVGSAIARKWYDTEGVDVIAGGSTSAVGLAIQAVAQEKHRIFLITDPGSTAFTGKACSPYGFHFSYDTYALANGTARAMVKRGGNTWFFITVDYAFGHALEHDAAKLVEAAGGKVLGQVRYPLGATDFGSYLLQAQASKAKVIGLANAGADTVNAIKQAAEFGIIKGGQQIAGLLILIPDVESLGLEAAQGLFLTTSFYWDLNDETRAWTKRFQAAYRGKAPPTMTQAGTYSAVLHYLKAVKAAGTTDADKVAAKMRMTPVNDMYNHNVMIRPDGRVLATMYLAQVKSPKDSKYNHDDFKILDSLPGAEAFQPMDQGGCSLAKKAE
ncbi:MAG TPA: ABC transporter substrate-binding protein [Alphaproteobacteria bacterium]|nr:ABC transporter substrate-binding protein [Alphaproteobacteria bacterium]